jgi:hypothetical protein
MHTVAEHFERSEPQVQAVYDKIVKTARACGPVGRTEKDLDPPHAPHGFAGIATRKTAIILTLKVPTDIKHARIIKHEQASAHRWHLNVKLEHPRDVDATVVRLDHAGVRTRRMTRIAPIVPIRTCSCRTLRWFRLRRAPREPARGCSADCHPTGDTQRNSMVSNVGRVSGTDAADVSARGRSAARVDSRRRGAIVGRDPRCG